MSRSGLTNSQGQTVRTRYEGRCTQVKVTNNWASPVAIEQDTGSTSGGDVMIEHRAGGVNVDNHANWPTGGDARNQMKITRDIRLAGKHFWVSDTYHHRVLRFEKDKTAEQLGEIVIDDTMVSGFTNPWAIGVTGDGTLFTQSGNKKVYKVPFDGTPQELMTVTYTMRQITPGASQELLFTAQDQGCYHCTDASNSGTCQQVFAYRGARACAIGGGDVFAAGMSGNVDRLHCDTATATMSTTCPGPAPTSP